MKNRSLRAFLFFVVAFFLFLGYLNSCSSNRPPTKPSNPNPSDGATGVSITPTLSWSCSDPDGDPLVYDIYFGNNPDKLLLVEKDHPTTSYQPPTTLQFDTMYFWKVVAKDDKGDVTEGDLWGFRTLGLSVLYEFPLESDTTAGPIFSSPAVGPDEKVYMGFNGGYLVLSPTKTEFVKTKTFVQSSPIVDRASNKAFFVDDEGQLLVYPDKASYRISNRPFYAAPVIFKDHVYVVDSDGQIFMVEKSTPSKFQKIASLGEGVVASPAVVDDKLLVATVEGNVYAVELPTGTVRWRKNFPGERFFGGFAVDPKKNLYVAGSALWCISPLDGRVLWSYRLRSQAFGSPVISKDGVVYVGDVSGTVYAVGPGGKPLWSRTYLSPIFSSCLLGDNGLVYVVGGTHLLALQPDSGELVSFVELKSFVESSPVLTSGLIFLADETGHFYVVQALSETIQDPESSWPMFQKDWYHSAAR